MLTHHLVSSRHTRHSSSSPSLCRLVLSPHYLFFSERLPLKVAPSSRHGRTQLGILRLEDTWEGPTAAADTLVRVTEALGEMHQAAAVSEGRQPDCSHDPGSISQKGEKMVERRFGGSVWRGWWLPHLAVAAGSRRGVALDTRRWSSHRQSSTPSR